MLSPSGVQVSTRKVKCIRVFIAARLRALLDQQPPPPLILVQVKLLNGHSLSPLAIRRFDRAEVLALLRMMMTRQLRRLAAADFFRTSFIGTQTTPWMRREEESARVGSLERVMHPPEGGPQAVFR